MFRLLEHELSDDLIRLSAYDLLVRMDVHSLPINPIRLFEIEPSIYYNSVQNLAIHTGIPLEKIISPDSAGLIYRINDGKDYIYINTDFSLPQILWNIVLAIAALELDAVPYRTYFDIPQNRYSVTEFAYYFLAPDVILEACNFVTQEKIFQYCLLPFRESVKKARKMKFRFKRRKSSGVEKILALNFRSYIEKYIEQ